MFAKTLGFFIFLIIFIMGFGMLLFLGGLVGYWLTVKGLERLSPKMAHKFIGYRKEEE